MVRPAVQPQQRATEPQSCMVDLPNMPKGMERVGQPMTRNRVQPMPYFLIQSLAAWRNSGLDSQSAPRVLAFSPPSPPSAAGPATEQNERRAAVALAPQHELERHALVRARGQRDPELRVLAPLGVVAEVATAAAGGPRQVESAGQVPGCDAVLAGVLALLARGHHGQELVEVDKAIAITIDFCHETLD